MRLGMRDRSSTASSFGQSSRDVETPPLSTSGRNSTSTTGRSSLGGFLSLSRFRQGSDPQSPRHGSPGTRSKSNSFAISREALVVPEREEGDTPGRYLERLESAVSRSVIATILSRSADPFSIAVLRSYTRRFSFFGEPIDMSLRKFLLHAELPKETQQVDRVVQAFADRYHECNPGIFPSSEVAYVIAFSIMMLHTDAFNKNVKRKMTKQDYIKNIRDQGISGDILSCIYDNICYTPFVHFDEDVDINGQKVLSFKPKNKGGKLKSAIPGADVVAKKPSGPLDPYNLLMENRLDELRPPIKDAMMLDDPYDYRGSQGEFDMQYLQRAFTHTGVLQIISARSRPAAYESQIINGAPNPTETQQGIVDLKVTKVGTLWRKSAKRSKTKRPWQEWGAILTGSQLYLFKNSHWAKGLVHQFKQHQKPGQTRTPVVFKPPLQDFKPDALIKTDNAVALVDSSYDKHKNAFVFVRPGAEEETLLADNESDLNEWLGLINYAAAFRAAGVRIRGMVGNEEDARNRELSRLDSTVSTRSIQTRMGEVMLTSRGLSPALQKQVMAARRQIMIHKIADLENQVTAANRQLERILRDARHLQVLAPIADKTRDDVRSAGGRINAAIIWTRRDVWRMKCHRDIIAMDVRLDGYTEAELAKLASEHAQQHAEAESAKEKPKMLSRLSSQRVRSPPQSPTMRHADERPSTAESVGTIGRDIFLSQSTSAQQQEGWQLPPLSLDINPRDQHRPSVSSTLLSTPASKRAGGTLTHSSSTSSVLQIQRTQSSNPPDTSLGRNSVAEGQNLDDKDLHLLARSTMGPAQDSPPRVPSIDNPQPGTSPESKHKGVRRSLQKTLRDGHHRDHTHRHRRNKGSDSTVRSGGQFDQDTEEATPGLQRDKPRFILHGKQASVVQFGGDWDRMRLRREQYDSQHPSTPTQTQKQADDAYNAYERRQSEQMRNTIVSPVVHDFTRHGSITEDDDDIASMLSEETRSFREDVEAAMAYSSTGPSASPKRLSSSTDERATDSDLYDLGDWDDNRRQTVIGPSRSAPQPGSTETQRHRRYSGLEKGEDGNVKIVETSDEEGENAASPTWKARQNRRTVIGPSSDGNGPAGKDRIGESALFEAARDRKVSGTSARGGASLPVSEEFDFEESVEGEGGFVRPVTDEELRKMSTDLRAVKTR
ncbi:hypothetical protein DOTSEDRAFT_70814 [Dothistroma septosporum NZE10]|uniref:SEC7 domain-containing protein n=1 Tax=Dothistroma septosporum (strain NZE10 / CBS 128990) TaxID=675120 RepID=N1PNB5_DOTSN|nr:hypothetical protein DOTSEDRAFT_70814 [Dothistroma septosporum NZE10]